MIRKIWNRAYSDYFMSSRLGEYRHLLEKAISHGYEIHSISSFWELERTGAINDKSRYFILRHDIDNGVETARLFWEIEKRLGIKSSYFFRLSTIDLALMKEIDSCGSDASYHYEELATVAKQIGLGTKQHVEMEMPRIKNMFRNNLLMLRETTDLPLTIVASHGDFLNRKLGITNRVILAEDDFRKELNIQLEVYDEEFMKNVNARISDDHSPLFWKPNTPVDAIETGQHVIYLLVHPRHWKTNRLANTLDNVKRLQEAVMYRIMRNLYQAKLDKSGVR